MSSVQEIEAALQRLNAEELQLVERRLAECRRKLSEDPHIYAKEEYQLSEAELDAFEKRMDEQESTTTVFHGKFDPSLLD